MSIQHELRRIVEARETLSRGEALILMQRILDDEATDVEIAALLGALAGRGETAEEVAGFASAMRAVATTLPLTAAEQASLVDTCGTGGDASGSFNISTAAALVAAAAGTAIAPLPHAAAQPTCSMPWTSQPPSRPKRPPTPFDSTDSAFCWPPRTTPP
jgi:anthranilate phosphoribosyltransferase